VAETELAPDWPRLRRSLRIADGFALYFVFTDWPEQVAAGKAYLESVLRLRTLRLREVRPESADGLVSQAMDTLLGAKASKASKAQPVWVECWRYTEDESWDRERQKLLARLNEGRGRLETEFASPLILVLPRNRVTETAETAPDLWSIRRLTLHLARPAPAPVAGERPPQAEASTKPPESDVFERAERRLEAWRRQVGAASANLWDAWQAVESLREAGHLEEALAVAVEALTLARSHREEGNRDGLRTLSIALDNLGDVSSDQGNLEAARAAYQESLELSRQLRAAQGDTPQSLRDLSVSLNNVGQVSRDLGDLAAARAAYQESLELSRQLLAYFGDLPQPLRDFGFAVNGLIQVAQAQGNEGEAAALKAESVGIAERLQAMKASGVG
jgi:tetratricopeptide (TPR) repeat protein